MAIKQVIVMRTDLGMRKGKMIAQGAHASMEFLRHTIKYGNSHLRSVEEEWLQGDHAKICVGVSSYEEMMDIFRKADAAGLSVDVVEDLGKTEFHGKPTRTCVAIGPDYEEKINPITGHLKLL